MNCTGSIGSTRLCTGSMPRLHPVLSVPHACAQTWHLTGAFLKGATARAQQQFLTQKVLNGLSPSPAKPNARPAALGTLSWHVKSRSLSYGSQWTSARERESPENVFGVECVPEVVGQQRGTRRRKIAPVSSEGLICKRDIYNVDAPSYWSP